MSTITTVRTEIERDRWGRPLIVPPGGGKPKGYTRVTTFVGALEDTYNLEKWKMRQVALGLADRPDLLLSVAAHRDDKKQLNKACEQAVEAAKASAKATTGTALHALTEIIDRGGELPIIPDEARADLNAYQQATAGLNMVAIEQFGVHDELQAAGTWDRIVERDGQRFIADLKTGSIEWGLGKIAQQLALYSRCQGYDPYTGHRTPLNVHQSAGIVIHLPAGQARCDLYWIDLNAGWEAVQLSASVRNWRKRKGLTKPFPKTS